jgi:dCMP deaminase
MPVLHSGYINFFKKNESAETLYVIGSELLASVDYLRKDLRALESEDQIKAANSLNIFKDVKVLNQGDIKPLDKKGNILIFPDEDISREVAKKFKQANIKFFPVFLRWDRRSAEELNEIDPDETITGKELHKRMIGRAMKQAPRGSDIWRRLGAILVDKDGKIISAAVNNGQPTPHSPWMEGDPRNIFNRGVAIEMSVFIHAEAALIAEAAKKGKKLAGGSIYVTTFPCPACAKLIAHSGLKHCYYAEGYSVLDGKRILDEYGVKTIRVKAPKSADDYEHPEAWVRYKKD